MISCKGWSKMFTGKCNICIYITNIYRSLMPEEVSTVGFKNRTSLYLLLLLHNKLLQNLLASDNCKHLTSLTKLLSAYLGSSSLDYLMRLQSFESLTGTGGFISKALVP